MKNVIKNDLVVCFDVDLTLIDYNIENKNEKELVKVGLIPGKEISIYPIKEHVQLVKNMKASNAFIIVWSGTGYKWANHIVEKLGLNDYVDMVMTKMKWYIDDTNADEWAKKLYYYPPYKKDKK